MASLRWEGRREPRRVRWTPLRVGAGLLVALLIGAVVLWWYMGHWAPGREKYPVQGVAVSAENGAVEWPTLRAQGVDFAYLAATGGDRQRDGTFSANWSGARAAGLRYGAMHGYSLCASASDQARLFISSVPRDNGALPPVVTLGFQQGCATRPSRDVVMSELNTFLNEIEAHSGKPAVLHISQAFEETYQISDGVNRTIWLDRAWWPPAYAAHPWVLWTANPERHLRGLEGTVGWTVVRP
jgi:lysozyme